MARAATSPKTNAARNSDDRLIALYLDMLAAERGAGTNTLSAYGRDLGDFSRHLKYARSSIAKADTDELRGYLNELSRRGLRVTTVARRLSAIPALPLSLRRRSPWRRSGRRARRPQARAHAAEN